MKIFLFHSTAGEGHKKIAEAIEDELKTRKEVSIVHTFDGLELASKQFRKCYPLSYFYLVKHMPKFWGALYETTDLPGVYNLIRPLRHAWNRLQSKALRDFVREQKPNVIIATHFYAAEVFATAKRKGELKSILVTVITDVMPHSFWVNEGTDFYWVMAEESKQNLIRRGVPDEKIIVGGIPVKKEFTRSEDRNDLIPYLNMSQGRFNILFSSGSFGIGPTRRWIQELSGFGDKIQVVVICGRNRELFEFLSAEKFSFPIILTGFINNMHEFMNVSDLLIAKSGGSTTCESLAKNLPMLITAPIPGQETRNAKWLLSKKASIEIKSSGDLKETLKDLLENKGRYQALKQRIAAIAKPNAAADLADFLLKRPLVNENK